jgi:hypothetical protein
MPGTKVVVINDPRDAEKWCVLHAARVPELCCLSTQAEAVESARAELLRLGGGVLEVRNHDGSVASVESLWPEA